MRRCEGVGGERSKGSRGAGRVVPPNLLEALDEFYKASLRGNGQFIYRLPMPYRIL